MKIYLEKRNDELVPTSMEIEDEKEVEFLLDQLRPKGRWIPISLRTVGEWEYKCSNCWRRGFMTRYPSCPYCMADMREETEDD